MFGDIPKIFDRNFIIAYLLPSSLALAFSLSITHGLGSLSSLDTTRGAVFAAFAFAIGMALMAANRNVTRVLEGYGRINPMRIMKPIQKLRYWYVRRQSLLAKRQRRRHRAGQKPDLNQLRDARIKYMTRLAERYPERKALLMATALGNAIRAFEGYPRVMYNFGVIEGWNRLIAVVPKEFLDLVDSAKAQTDLWINVWLLNILLVLDSFATWYLPASLRPLNSLMSTRQLAFTCVGAVLVISFASTMAASAAVEWGSMVKATLDVFLPSLYAKLGLPAASGNSEARASLGRFTRATIYRLPDVMPDRNWVQVSAEEVDATRAIDASSVDATADANKRPPVAQRTTDSSPSPNGDGWSKRVANAEKILYFAYGSNMLSSRLRERVSSAIKVATGFISSHRLTFDKRSSSGSGKCDAQATNRVEDRVYGVVYQINAADKPRLDELEGLGTGYAEKTVEVTSSDNKISSITYYATSKDRSLTPFTWYKELVVAGAHEHSLPPEYIASIERVESREDPDKARAAKERAITRAASPHR